MTRVAMGAAVLLLTAPIGALTTPIGAQAASAAPARTVLPSPRSALLSGPQGPADPKVALHLRIYLAGQDPRGRVETASAVSRPGSPLYAHYLSAARYQQRFGTTAAQIGRVGDWLRSQGMTVTATNQHYVAADTTIGQADTAFDTDIDRWTSLFPGDPFTPFAPVGDVSVPSQVGADIATVTGLSGGYYPGATKAASTTTKPADTTPPPASPTNTADYPCSHWWGEHTVAIPEAYGHTTAPTQLCGYTVKQMRSAYGITTSRYTGKGSTVAILLDSRSSTMEADADRFFADQGVPGFAPGQYTEDLGPNFTASCGTDLFPDNPEESLDVETVHIIAPDAKVVFVSTGCDYAPLDDLEAATRVVDRRLADVVTDSWPTREDGYSPAEAAAWELVLQQGAVEGIGFDFASGDFGDSSDDSLNHATVAFPSSDPWATAVGGTSLAIGRDGRRIAEYGWGTTATMIGPQGYDIPPPGEFVQGSGGGPSAMFAEPGYQRGVVPDALADSTGTGTSHRIVPDVSADAAAFWLVGYTGAAADGGYGEVPEGGGTSGSSPILAALEADAQQAAGHAIGFLNPALYRLAGTPALHDILPVNPADPPLSVGVDYYDQGEGPYLTSLGEDGALTVAPGYDDVTGIGTPAGSFVTALAAN